MNRCRTSPLVAFSAAGLLITLVGCGEQPTPPVAAVQAQPAGAAALPGLPAAASQTSLAPPSANTAATATPNSDPPAARTAQAAASAPMADIPFAEEGTPEWHLYEITRLLVIPMDQKQVLSADGQAQVVDRAPEEIAAERKKNLREVVSHAGQVIAATHDDPNSETTFTNAVHYLSIANLELALMGEAENARQLGEVSEAIYSAKPKSAAAADSSAQLVELARVMAERFGPSDPAWARAHATQARLFAERFPQEQNRAAMILMEAGRTCESAGLPDSARDCYLELTRRCSETPHVETAAALLRRMNLVGRALSATDLGGPTIDGGYISIDQLRGKHVLVCFWSSDSPTFQTDFPILVQLQQQHGDQLVVLGVNLDLDESAVDHFLESHPLKWRQIFDADPARRGTNNSVASYYGVSGVPLYWLIDPEGKVLAAPADLSKLPIAAP